MDCPYSLPRLRKGNTMRRTLPATVVFSAVLIAPALWIASLSAADAPAKPKAPGLGDPGKLVSIALDSGRTKDGLLMLSGRDAVQQLVITGKYDSGQTRDLTRKSTYQAEPAGVVKVDA